MEAICSSETSIEFEQITRRYIPEDNNVEIVGSNPTQGMDVCVCVYSVFMLSCVQVAALRPADHSSKERYRLCEKDYETEEEARRQKEGL
jgi:hypothetical protein